MKHLGKRGRCLILSCSVLCVAVGLAACGSSGSDTTGGPNGAGTSESSEGAKADVHVAFFNGFQGNAFGAAQVAAAKETAAKEGAELSVFEAPFDATAQLAQIQDATTTGKFQAYVIMPPDGNAIVPAVEQAVTEGIKVFSTLNTIGPNIASIEPGVAGMSGVVAEELGENGRDIGDAIVAACEGSSPCNVIYLPGSVKQASEKIRDEGVKEVLAAHGEVEIVAEREGEYLQGPAMKVATDLLAATGDVDVIASAADQMTLGIERAVDNAGLTGEVKLVGNGASVQGVEAVASGRWFATPVFLPKTEAELAVKYAIEAALGNDVPSATEVVSLSPIGRIVTREVLSSPEGKKFKPEWQA